MLFFYFKSNYEFIAPILSVMYPIFIGLFNFFIIIGLWLWFKHPVYIYKFYKWYIFQKYGMRRTFVNVDSVIIHIAQINMFKKDRTSLLFIHGAGGHLLNWSHTIKV